MNFSGIYDHTLDVKHRLTVPARARAALADGVTVYRAGDGGLQLWPTADFKAAADKLIQDANAFSTKGKERRRRLFNHSEDLELDKVGRVGLSAKALEHSGLVKPATVVGSGEFLEVWLPERYEAVVETSAVDDADLFDD